MASSHLPEDVVKDILVRLPVKSLLRFRCVHKSWSGLFQNPNFISQQHLFHQTQTDSSSCLLVTNNNVLSFVPPPPDDVSESLNLDLNFFKEDLQDLVIGPCINGIICLFNYPYRFVCGQLENNVDPNRIALWNPALRQFKILPKNPLNCPSTLDYIVDALGFGYDPKSSDYKVVRIVTFYLGMIDDDSPYRPPLFEVYSLSTNSWRKLDDAVLDGYVTRAIPGLDTQTSVGEIYLNGAYHWWGATRERNVDLTFNDIQAIVSFDMSDEVFRIISLPDLSDRTTIWKTLTELNNSIALVVNKVDGIEKNFDIWVMREYGIKESWIKQFTIGPISGVERSLGFGKKGELFLVGKNGGVVLVLCNFCGQEIKNVQVKEFPDSLKTLCGVIYVESLVSITAGNVIQN